MERSLEEVVERIVLSESGTIFANRSFTKMYGYGLEEVIGMDGVELVPLEMRGMVARRISDFFGPPDVRLPRGRWVTGSSGSSRP